MAGVGPEILSLDIATGFVILEVLRIDPAATLRGLCFFDIPVIWDFSEIQRDGRSCI